MKDSDDEIIAEEEMENPAAALKKLREKLKAAVKEKQEYLEGWQRSRADFANFKRDEAQREQEHQERLTFKLVEEIVPLLDSFDLALQHADPQTQQTLTPMHRQFLDVLKRLGVEPIGAGEELIGKPFDPTWHEAIQEISSEPELEHHIVKVFRSGYRLGERVIRPAQVGIGVFNS